MDYWNDSDGGYLGFWGETEVEMKCTIVLYYFSLPIFGSNSCELGQRRARIFCPLKSELIYVSETREEWLLSGRGEDCSSSGDVSGSEITPGIRRRRDEEVGSRMLRSTTEIDRKPLCRNG
jgi:hypothetical protein